MRFVCAVAETVVRRDPAQEAMLHYRPTKGGASKPVLFPQLAAALAKYAAEAVEEETAVKDSLTFDKQFELSSENLSMLEGRLYDCLTFSSVPAPSVPAAIPPDSPLPLSHAIRGGVFLA